MIGPQRWRVAPVLVFAKFAGALLLVFLAALSGDERERLLLCAAGALALGVYGLRDVLAPVRLSADAEGVTVVHGFAGHRRIPWDEVERVVVTERRSHGLRTELLEIDTGESLHLFSRHDLGAPVQDVEEALRELRPSAEEEHADAGERRSDEGERPPHPHAAEQRAADDDQSQER
ncbi:PH domain-containing protein [Actinoallomurus sp. NBC_01490]|uniref:PH domain-containing protein n=1 Tax=Actinoallomurus sp. NBC_01490 TaxID=2903557 RepID=UPI002E339FEA|nr:PH domain-containing protein [Actinoallomurus sp. NBC_01490]